MSTIPAEPAAPDHPALDRLSRIAPTTPAGGTMRPMGNQPALDGVRAVSVMAVLLYHAGFGWMHGGFYGVEVFFVVSGFLITSLLLEERERNATTSLRGFWQRRARRLFPALATMLVLVGVWVALFGTAVQQSDLKRDYLPSIFYVANWAQILADVPYFGNVSPLRHVWSLAVEEQWYLLMPLVFVALLAWRTSHRRRAATLAGAAVAIIVLTWWAARAPELTADRANFLYLSTPTRASGLLLGAAAAFVWRPWRSAQAAEAKGGRALDALAVVTALVLLWSFFTGEVFARSTYRWHLPLVTISSLVLVLVVVHPASALARRAVSWRPLVEIGKRSYGLYLWSWPISVIVGAYTGSVTKFLWAMLLTAVVSEACYRFVETPVRKGALGRWWHAARTRDWRIVSIAGAVTVVALVLPLVAFYAAADDTSIAEDTSTEVVFEAPVTTVASSVDAVAGSAAVTSTAPAVTAPAVTAPQAALPRRVVVVGDSQAHSLAINLPDGIESTFAISDGSVDGCSVYDSGRAVSARGFERSFVNCTSWADQWSDAAADGRAEIALVVLGAWDVFDVEQDGQTLGFATAANDERFLAGVRRGVDALAAQGTHVALLEIACMRPQDVEGAGVPALPERGDDQRVAHLNALLRQVAAADPERVTFVEGPDAWCADEAIATDLGYRWDGVHMYKPGAKLTYETIAPALLDVPVPA
jgi:peptidoglycan/LPS O-acetylase OafA/YrhL